MAGKKKTVSPTRSYIKWFWIIVLSPLVGLALMVLLASFNVFGVLPTFEELENPDPNLASEVFSSDMIVLGKYFYQNRSNIKYKELSPNIVNALKATEDIRFEEHSGVDIRGLIRAIAKMGRAGGGSTLTQQLAKNLFHEKPKSKLGRIKQKIQEWVISARLEKSYTKPEILAMYLNTVEFGHNAYGIKSAAKTFFNKTPAELKIEEASLLVGMLQAPSRYSPVSKTKEATQRRNVVMSQMLKYKFISQSYYDSLKTLPIKLKFQAEDHNEGLATYFREVLRLELIKWCREHRKADGSTYNLYRDGLKIYTTIDTRLQAMAEAALKQHLKDLQKQFNEHWKNRNPFVEHPEIITNAMKQSERYQALKAEGLSETQIEKNFKTKTEMTIFTWKGETDTLLSPLDSIKYYKKFLRSAIASINPHTGHVKAWVGGNDYRYFKYDQVKDGKRQVGSTFKPFLYTIAMQEGYSPCYKIPNARVTISQVGSPDWSPENSDGKYGGMLTLKEALAESVNSISAYLMKQFGPQPMIEIVRKMGITAEIPAVPSICLGTPDVSLLEMVGAYSTFANKGVWTEPIYITRIEDKNGVVLQEFVPKNKEAISEETAYLMLNLMQGVTTGTGARLRFRYNLTQPIAGKTGTTQNNSDGWFMGITPDLVTGVWTGCEDRSVHFRTTQLGQGANTALPIWALYMKNVWADKELKYSQQNFDAPKEKLSVELDCGKYEQQNGNGNFESKPDF
ncbi:MAG TPA: transglycosylase domain-containing protein [Bacteroidia bacterium]|nr:transglycosylase domain-containing protein [Bacteroidia bacterium]HNU33663.1 transglycosylase domain-containing protein [Bacteroidia bacterium]